MLDKSKERSEDMFAKAVDGTKVNLLEDMLRWTRLGSRKLGRMVRDVLERSRVSKLY